MNMDKIRETMMALLEAEARVESMKARHKQELEDADKLRHELYVAFNDAVPTDQLPFTVDVDGEQYLLECAGPGGRDVKMPRACVDMPRKLNSVAAA